MKIRYSNKNLTLRPIFLLSFFIISWLILSIYIYLSCNYTTHTFLGFFSWYYESFFYLKHEMDNSFFVPFSMLVLLPVSLIILLIVQTIKRQKEIQLYNSQLNIKYVDFRKDKIYFTFNKPQCNLACSYQDINKLNMVLNTELRRSKNTSYYAVSDVNLYFSIAGNRTFELSASPLYPIKFAYSIIDYSRRIKNFNFSFKGFGEPVGMREKIEDYLQKGFKQILSKDEELLYKLLSVVFFVIGLFPFFDFKTIVENVIYSGHLFLFVPMLIPLLISFVFDIILLLDKQKERKYNLHY